MKAVSVFSEPTATELLLLDVRAVARLLGVSVRSIERSVKNREFLQPIRLNARTVRWSRAAVEKWIAERTAAAEIDGGEPASLSPVATSEA